MAVGGALRAAIKAGNWVSAARESRRRARALAQLNVSGGISNRTLNARRSRGIPGDLVENQIADYPVQSYFSPSTGMEWDDIGLMGSGQSMRGNEMTRFADGSTVVFPPAYMRRPIEAPYEGVRVWNPSYEWFEGMPPWMGRGRAPLPDRPLLDQYGYPALGPALQDPYSLNVPRAFGGISDYNIPF